MKKTKSKEKAGYKIQIEVSNQGIDKAESIKLRKAQKMK